MRLIPKIIWLLSKHCRNQFLVVALLSLFTQLFFAVLIHLLQTNDWKSHEIFSALATEQHSLTLVALSPIGWCRQKVRRASCMRGK
jgi:hypothetical protein